MGSEQDGPFGALINALPDTLPTSPKIMGEEVEELVKRLRQEARDMENHYTTREISTEAADTIESLRASLTRAQYTCEAHANEVLKGGECVWCMLTRVEEERDAMENALVATQPIISALISAEYNVETWGLRGRLAAIDAALGFRAGGEKPDWVLAPLEATDEMARAAMIFSGAEIVGPDDNTPKVWWRRMIAARPERLSRARGEEDK